MSICPLSRTPADIPNKLEIGEVLLRLGANLSAKNDAGLMAMEASDWPPSNQDLAPDADADPDPVALTLP